MKTGDTPRSIHWPTDEEREAAFKAYSLAVGKVSHAWNSLHEKLGQLFVVISNTEDRGVAFAIWYSTDSDRAQRNMLRGAVSAADVKRWPSPEAKDDTVWLLDRADALADARNNAVHAPCSLYIGSTPDGSAEMGAAFFRGHPRAKELKGKRLLVEFEWCEVCAEGLGYFTEQIETGMAFPARYSWPERPSLPTRGQRNSPQVPPPRPSRPK